MEPGEASPLRHFVLAKRTVNGIFEQILLYAKEASAFAEETWCGSEGSSVVGQAQCEELLSCCTKLTTIRDVLARRHMKVAFFGRTSNGKSTVINAMLRDRVLPTGIGHTTNCFLRVEGTDGEEPYLTTEASAERRSLQTVNHLAHALHMDPTLDSGSLVKVFWPKGRCTLLRDDLVLMDSPGTDVTEELDSWIDKFCLDADVFVLVGNAESTLMNTEKLFFHKVSERISKPNIFILHNRWDASVTEPDHVEEVRKQHLDRGASFLAEELRVVSLEEAPGRIFFVSAKEVLYSRMHRAQGMPETGGALAEGFHERLREFQSFERTFEEFISQSAVKTKFGQHTVRAGQITQAVRDAMDAVNISAADRKICCLEEREDLRDRLDFVRGQMGRLSSSLRDQISTLSEDVAARVAAAMLDQIRSLAVLVEEFRSDFNPTPDTLALYKAKLVSHVEERMVSSLSYRCSPGVGHDVQATQTSMMESVRPLLSLDAQEHFQLPGSRPDLLLDLNLAQLCGDFQEDIRFRFSLGWTALVTRFIGPVNAKRALAGVDPRIQNMVQEGANLKDEMVVSIATGLVSVTSRASMTVIVIGGVVWRSVGWRLIALSLSLYGLLYLYEKLTWTEVARERALKRQFVEHASQRLRALVPVASHGCSQQVHSHLMSVFSRLSQRVDLSEAELEEQIRLLTFKIQQLESVQRRSKVLRSVQPPQELLKSLSLASCSSSLYPKLLTFRNRATELQGHLDVFSAQYLHG
ncbi:mitofusin-1-like isoform X1 [Gadus morhua]|uniref:mitofusin-1-like isoform X1 n=1 Tax=Gadus morhua TaxID=8049 RepID=UPI0011B3AD38|nr:mitofusin-1-like isoform X1 [Gadus morhua]